MSAWKARATNLSPWYVRLFIVLIGVNIPLQNFSVALRQVIEQPSFKTDAENYDLFIGVYDDLIVNFLTKMSPKVRDMKNDEEEQYRALETYAQYGIGTKPGA
jgi:hypothetical protein